MSKELFEKYPLHEVGKTTAKIFKLSIKWVQIIIIPTTEKDKYYVIVENFNTKERSLDLCTKNHLLKIFEIKSNKKT